MSNTIVSEPKLFISYSWSSPDHEAWVITLAEELTSQGIHVILDKWDLQPGHDAHAFMESMVTDPTVNKVLIICDENYANKSNGRSGGVGTEAQIITPEIYKKREQDKFVAVVRERDSEGKPFLPTYYGGRIYIDLTSPSTYASEFDRIVRWVWGQPLHIRPAKGARPSFLATPVIPGKIVSSVAFRRAFDSIRSGASNSPSLSNEYFNIILNGLEEFRIRVDGDNISSFDDVVVSSIDEFTPYRNEIVEIFSAVAQSENPGKLVDVIHKFFENLISFLNNPKHIQNSRKIERENFHFIIHELFLYCVGSFLQYEKYDSVDKFISDEYYWKNDGDVENCMHNFLVFRDYMETLEHRNRRLNLRRLSVRADMLKSRCAGTGINFDHLMSADFLLYFRSIKSNNWDMWWPETLLYTGRFSGPFEIFARSKSSKYFEKIKPILKINNKEDLQEFITKTREDSRRIPKWQFETIYPEKLMGLDLIATTP